MKSSFASVLTLALVVALPSPAPACDACALFVADGSAARGFTASVASQFTRLGSVWSGATRLGNPVDQFLESTTTQFTLGYTRGGPWSAQLTLPYIQRRYLRPEHAAIERGRVSGLGDATLATRWTLLDRTARETTWSLAALGGVELGTGNAAHLGDELGHHFHHHAAFPDSGVHGHDLALGSGSTDYVLGADAAWRRGRTFARAALQYKLRRPGKFGYRLADDTAWEAGVGRHLVLDENLTLSAQALFAAEHKGFDTLGGVAQVDTAASVHYVGARLATSLGLRFSADASLEFPVRIRTSETMVVPDYRARAAFSWRL